MFRLHLSWLLVHFLPLFAEHVARVDVQPAAAEQALASQQATGRHGQTNPLPAGALARIQTARPGHEAAVTCVAFAPRGLTLASTSFDEALSLWDPATGRELRRITGHPKLVSAAFSPDGQTVASAGWDGTIRLWQAATGRPFRSLRAQGDRVLAIAFSPNGKLLASGDQMHRFPFGTRPRATVSAAWRARSPARLYLPSHLTGSWRRTRRCGKRRGQRWSAWRSGLPSHRSQYAGDSLMRRK
jgi:WD domain, G-beta repeat